MVSFARQAEMHRKPRRGRRETTEGRAASCRPSDAVKRVSSYATRVPLKIAVHSIESRAFRTDRAAFSIEINFANIDRLRLLITFDSHYDKHYQAVVEVQSA